MIADDDGQRYRQAAEDALEQLDWCIGYLHGDPQGNDLPPAGDKPRVHQTQPDAGTGRTSAVRSHNRKPTVREPQPPSATASAHRPRITRDLCAPLALDRGPSPCGRVVGQSRQPGSGPRRTAKPLRAHGVLPYPMLLIDPCHIEPRRRDAGQPAVARFSAQSATHSPAGRTLDPRPVANPLRDRPCTQSSRGARSGFVGERRQSAPLAAIVHAPNRAHATLCSRRSGGSRYRRRVKD